jgi:hypothetical protein
MVYALYRDSKYLKKLVEVLLKTCGFDLSNGGDLEELQQFQEYLSNHKINLYDGMSPERLVFREIPFLKRNRLYCMMRTRVTTMLLPILKPPCAKSIYVTLVTCYTTLYISVTKLALCVLSRHLALNSQSKYCDTCNRTFLCEKCYQNNLTLRVKNTLACEWRQVCQNCSFLTTPDSKHEYFKQFSNYCNNKQASCHFCYVGPL